MFWGVRMHPIEMCYNLGLGYEKTQASWVNRGMILSIVNETNHQGKQSVISATEIGLTKQNCTFSH